MAEAKLFARQRSLYSFNLTVHTFAAAVTMASCYTVYQFKAKTCSMHSVSSSFRDVWPGHSMQGPSLNLIYDMGLLTFCARSILFCANIFFL